MIHQKHRRRGGKRDLALGQIKIIECEPFRLHQSIVAVDCVAGVYSVRFDAENNCLDIYYDARRTCMDCVEATLTRYNIAFDNRCWALLKAAHDQMLDPSVKEKFKCKFCHNPLP